MGPVFGEPRRESMIRVKCLRLTPASPTSLNLIVRPCHMPMSHLLRFLLLLAGALSRVSVAEVPKELPAGAPSPVGYATVSAALRDLQSRKDVGINVAGGWTIVNDPVNNIIWSFAPASHPAYPS